jgi:site-specific recombinase XerC
VAAYIGMLGKRLAAIRMLFDWLVVGQVLTTNPAAPVRGPNTP